LTIATDERTRRYVTDALAKESERSCALVAGAMLDEALCYLLCEQRERTLKARIEDARRRKLTRKPLNDDLELIRQIRNSAAHVLGTPDEPWAFARADVRPLCRRLRLAARHLASHTIFVMASVACTWEVLDLAGIGPVDEA